MNTPTVHRRTQHRPEIQALRALAVLLVLTFHLTPGILPGGFVGVDVFFAISGYLITGNLLREASRTGGIKLLGFWARRARRLLPAAMVVLLASAGATALWVPRHLWEQFFSEIAASALYVQNWLLAANSVDYMAAQNQASPVQHFWTLSVEEQFYMALPVLIIIAILTTRSRWRLVTGWTLLAVLVASLAYSIFLTHTDQSVAYFSTGTRAWEFAAGSLLAYLGWRAPRHLRTAGSIAGFSIIALSAIVLTGATPFPGLLAGIPVIGALLIMWAGEAPGLVGASIRLRPVQWFGDISYSLYLWHWPLLVLFPFVFGQPAGVGAAVAIAGGSIILAAASKYFIEDPARGIRRGHRNWVTFSAAAIGVVAILGISTACTSVAIGQTKATASAVHTAETEHADCFGAAAMQPGADCAADVVGAPIDPAFARTDAHGIEKNDCTGGTLNQHIVDAVECTYGDPNGIETVVLVGDSHARQWMPAIEQIALAKHWKLITLIRSSCPFADSPVIVNGVAEQGCTNWARAALPRILEIRPTLVFDSSLAPMGYAAVNYGLAPSASQVTAHTAYMQAMVNAGIKLVVFKDDPYEPQNVPDCIAANGPPGAAACAGARATVLDNRDEPMVTAARSIPGVAVFDLSDSFCNASTCPVIIGGVIVYQDRHHLTATYSRTLAPSITKLLDVSYPDGR